MTVSASVLLPEPFGPMIACTSPLRTTRSIPFRISFPSTFTWRSLMTRSGNGHFLLCKIGECHSVERLRDGRLQLHPHRASAAVLLADAVEDRIALRGADLRLDRTLERAHDVPRGDRRRIAGQRVAAARAALAVHQARFAQDRDQLLEICLGQVLALRDRVERNAPLLPVPREVDHQAHAVFTPRGDMKGGLWISEHYSRNCRSAALLPPPISGPNLAETCLSGTGAPLSDQPIPPRSRPYGLLWRVWRQAARWTPWTCRVGCPPSLSATRRRVRALATVPAPRLRPPAPMWRSGSRVASSTSRPSFGWSPGSPPSRAMAGRATPAGSACRCQKRSPSVSPRVMSSGR